jgi:hypothetical protein
MHVHEESLMNSLPSDKLGQYVVLVALCDWDLSGSVNIYPGFIFLDSLRGKDEE